MLKRTVLVLSLSSVLLTACGSTYRMSDSEAYQYGYEYTRRAICLESNKEFQQEFQKAQKKLNPEELEYIINDFRQSISFMARYNALNNKQNFSKFMNISPKQNKLIEQARISAKKNVTMSNCEDLPIEKDVSSFRARVERKFQDRLKREKEEKAKQAFYETPEGKIYLAKKAIEDEERSKRRLIEMYQYNQPSTNSFNELQRAVEQFNHTVDKHRTRVTNCYGGSYGNSATCYTY